MGLFVMLLLGLASMTTVQAAEFHSFDNEFDADDTDTPKWLADANCLHGMNADGTLDGSVAFDIDATENDPNFATFAGCVMLDYAALLTNAITPITAAGCTQPARASMDDMDPEYKHWEFSETIAGATTTAAAGADGNSNCGAYKDGFIIFLAMYCYRDEGFLKEGDAIFLAQCDAAEENALVTMVTYGEKTITGLAKQQILRRSTISFDVLAGDNPPDYDSDVVKTSYMLGEAARLRFCIIIDTAEGDTRTEFADGYDPMGVVVTSCVATRDPSQGFDAADINVTPGTDGDKFVTDTGCGNESPTAKQFLTTLYVFQYGKAASDGANAYLRSPNCFYSPVYEVTAFLGKTIGGTDRKTIITCSVPHYCTASTEVACFGSLSGALGDAGYPTCPAGFTGRKRRDTFAGGPDNMPESVNTTFTVRFPSETEEDSANKPCFKKSIFFALTAALVVLMVFTLTIVGVLLYKLISDKGYDGENSRTAIKDGMDRDTHSSKTGFSNKGFRDDKNSFYH